MGSLITVVGTHGELGWVVEAVLVRRLVGEGGHADEGRRDGLDLTVILALLVDSADVERSVIVVPSRDLSEVQVLSKGRREWLGSADGLNGPRCSAANGRKWLRSMGAGYRKAQATGFVVLPMRSAMFYQ